MKAWDRLNWGKPSLAVCASFNGTGVVLYTAGPHVRFDIEESGLGPQLDDLGLDEAPDGLSVWEGSTAGGGYTHNGDYADTYLTGTFRPLTDEEWDAVKAGRCPWDATLWELPDEPEPPQQDLNFRGHGGGE